ncbi:GNAT family N-acetyltransferase [Pontibacter silvestris]|uniref:GNAT family N-acetyltransferase n=1 Tax=Pontibacter silvestris TaxID=2305183 RepID=A0ABW4X0X1_9BACT|nr:GNAT family N-acetyltransferase [Pontibacter silvestris]MCC9135780.1 N-acetyltransferase family protein [Pontibacter silvestris]
MIEIISMLPAHAEAVLRIYKEGLQTGNATFNTRVPLWEEWDKEHHVHSRLVAVENDEVLGWVALSPVSSRHCYRGVAEFSIYIGAANRGRGVGALLLKNLIEESEANGIWSLYSATLQENTASITLQKQFGFREVGYREKIAQLNGVWRNTILLERRSLKVGQ